MITNKLLFVVSSWSLLYLHISCSITSLESRSVHVIVEKYGTAERATDENVAHAHCMLVTEGYKHILRIRTTYCFPRQQWLYERPSVVNYTYIACFVTI